MRGSLLAVTALLACKEPNPAFVGDDAGSTSTATTSTSSASSSVGSVDSITEASATTTDGSGADTTSAHPTTSEADTQDPDTTSATSDASSSSATTGAPPADPYPACDLLVDPPCPREFPECIEVAGFNWCTQLCDVDEDCPAPLTGNPSVVCAGPDGNQCALDCAGGETCPDGMSCEEVVANIFRCVWSA